LKRKCIELQYTTLNSGNAAFQILSFTFSVFDLYKNQINDPDPEREKMFERLGELNSLTSVIQEELYSAQREESQLSESSWKLKHDIASIERSIEDEQSEQLNVIEKYESERKSILMAQEREANNSAEKITTLQKKLNYFNVRSKNILKEQMSQEYELKLAVLQKQVSSMEAKLAQTQDELSSELKGAQTSLNKALSAKNEASINKLYRESELNDLRKEVFGKDKRISVEGKITKEKLSAYSGAVDSLMKEIIEKDAEISSLGKLVSGDANTREALLASLTEKDKMLETSQERIVILEKEVKSLQEEMWIKERDAEKRLTELRVEMTVAVTEAEVTASLKLQAFEDELREVKRSNAEALSNKHDAIAQYDKDRKTFEESLAETERIACLKLTFMKDHISEKLAQAEAAASASLEAATRQLSAVCIEQDKDIMKKDKIIRYLEKKATRSETSSPSSASSSSKYTKRVVGKASSSAKSGTSKGRHSRKNDATSIEPSNQ